MGDAQKRLRELSSALGTLRDLVSRDGGNGGDDPAFGDCAGVTGRRGAQQHLRDAAELLHQRATTLRLAFEPVASQPPSLADCAPAADMFEEAATALVAGVIGISMSSRGTGVQSEDEADSDDRGSVGSTDGVDGFWASQVLKKQLRSNCLSCLAAAVSLVEATEAQYDNSAAAPASFVGRVWDACKSLEHVSLSNAGALRAHATESVLPLLKDSVRELGELEEDEVPEEARRMLPHLATVVRCAFMMVKQTVDATRAIDRLDNGEDFARLGTRAECETVDKVQLLIQRVQEAVDDLVCSFEMLETGDDLSELEDEFVALEEALADAGDRTRQLMRGCSGVEEGSELSKTLASVGTVTERTLARVTAAFKEIRGHL